MAPIETVVADAALAASLVSSVVLANCYGEVCGAAPGADVPAFGVFASALVFTPVRWLLALIALACATANGALHGLFGTDAVSWWLIVGGHAMFGCLSLWWLDCGVRRIRRNHFLPRFYGLLGGVLLPLPMFVLAAAGCNVDWLGTGPMALACLTMAVFVAHFVSYRAGRNARSMARPAY